MGYKLQLYFTFSEIYWLANIKDQYIKALTIIGRVYAERLDKSGNAELGHFIRVSENLDTIDEKVTGLLHDVVEDGYLTFSDLIIVGFPLHIIKALKVLARDKSLYPNYEDYITSVLESNDELAIRVKYVDMQDNSSEKRLVLLEESVRNKMTKKYDSQLPRLRTKVEELNGSQKLERKYV